MQRSNEFHRTPISRGLSTAFPLALAGIIMAFLPASDLQAQGFRPVFGQTVQLPVVSNFNVRTVVSVPDGGSMSLGGVNRFRSSSRSSGIPGTFGRPFANRSTGFEARGGNMVVHPRIIINRELEADVLAQAARNRLLRQPFDPNGSVDVQRRADFISRNVGNGIRR